MAMMNTGKVFLHRLLRRVTKGWVVDVPSEMSCCEFDCHKLECAHGEWETCEARLACEQRLMAAGSEADGR